MVMTLRQFTHDLTRRMVEDDSLQLEEVLAPSVMTRFDGADRFLDTVYDDVVQALSTRPADAAREANWRADYDFLDVIIDHRLLALPKSLFTLAALREAVRARRPTNEREIADVIAKLLPSVDGTSP